MTNWQEWDTKALEHQYSPSCWSKRFENPDDVIKHHVTTVKLESAEVHRSVQGSRDIEYGSGEQERIDIFGSESLPKDAPIFVYIHGGYWQELSRCSSAYPVRPLVEKGTVVAIVGYELAPKATMVAMISQIQSALRFLLKYAQNRGSRGVYVSGHSAGGHLAAMALAQDFSQHTDLNLSLIKGFIPISGVYDVRPIVHTYVNGPLNLTEGDAWSYSPMNHLESLCKNCRGVACIVAVGEHDSQEFKRQSREFHQALEKGGVNSRYFESKSHDHFDIVENLQNNDHPLTQEILSLISTR